MSCNQGTITGIIGSVISSIMHILTMRPLAAWADIGQLILRVALGSVFMWHGYDKVFVKGSAAISGFLASLGIPAPSVMVYLLSYGELVGGLLLILGALTFWVSLGHVIIATVALFMVHLSNGFFVSDGGYEFVMLIGAGSLFFLTAGPGKYAVDTMLSSKRTSPAPMPAAMAAPGM